MEFSKKNITICLIVIGSISLSLKLSLVDFSIPILNNDQAFSLRAFSYIFNDFEVNPKQNPGWPLFLSFFYRLIESNDFLTYSNITRIVSMLSLTLAIIPMYMLGRKFFNEKYSLVAAALLAFEPHINFRAGFGYTEAIYIPLVILTAYFILNKNNKLVIISFIFAGLMWWARLEGIIMLFVISIVYFSINKKSKKLVAKYVICIFIFIIIVSPFLIQRNIQFDDPLYFYYNDHLFVDDYMQGGGLQQTDKTASNFIQEKGIVYFLETFLVKGLINVVEQTARLSFPYLFILIPFGVLFSLRAFDQDKLYIKANWIIILAYAAAMIIPLAVITERRFLFALLPFLIIFAVIPIQRVVEYGLSTFSFSQRNKNIFLVIVLAIILLSSGMFMLRYDVKDPIEEHEKIEFANFLVNDIDGLILDSPSHRTFDHGYFYYVQLDNPPENFKKYQILDNSIFQSGKLSSMKGTTINEIILDAKMQNAKYLLVDNKDMEPLKELYENDNSYEYLIKVYDTKEQGMERITIKVFEINYDKFIP